MIIKVGKTLIYRALCSVINKLCLRQLSKNSIGHTCGYIKLNHSLYSCNKSYSTITETFKDSKKPAIQLMHFYRQRPEEIAKSFFESSKEIGTDYVDSSTILSSITKAGIAFTDPRLSKFMKALNTLSKSRHGKEHIPTIHGIKMNLEEFLTVVHEDFYMLLRVASNDFCIPDFQSFRESVKIIYEDCLQINDGNVANYIPQLAMVKPDNWGVSVCTIDGQCCSFGDFSQLFTLQSTSKPISYALALTEFGPEEVHNFVGYEPSGVPFNRISLNKNNKPHNPLINSGAIVVASLIQRHLNPSERFAYVHGKFSEMGGGEHLGFNNAVYLSERESADRNYAIAYYMRENNCFPKGSDLDATMELYFQMCSLESNCTVAAIMASTLANGGVNPFSEKKILSSASVRDTLSVMHSCGMYDYSGQFAFKVGLPAKSGVSGLIIIVVPEIMGIALWSPRINHQGNSVRGLAFCEKLVKQYMFHHYEANTYLQTKRDPRKHEIDEKTRMTLSILFAANNNDISSIRRSMLAGFDLNTSDYDGRTALHIAASVGALDIVRFLVEVVGVETMTADRWGNTPLSEAKRFGHEAIANVISQFNEANEKS